MRKILIKIGILSISLTMPLYTIACGTKTHEQSLITPEFSHKYSMDHKEEFLWKEVQTEAEIRKEDIELSKKYSQYGLKESLHSVDNISSSESDYDRVLLFLDGGPRFFLDNKTIENKVYDFWGSKEITNVTSVLPKNDINTIDPVIPRVSAFLGSVNSNVSLRQKKDNTLRSGKSKYYNFNEAQTVIPENVFTTIYSYKEMTEIQKMSFINLHKVIQDFHNKGKKVYIWGSSFGAMILSGYLSRYGNDADGMFLAGGSINYISKLYPILDKKYEGKNRTSIQISYIKKHFEKRNIYDAQNWKQNINNAPMLIVKDYKKSQIKEFYIDNFWILLNVANNLINTELISKRNLDDKTTIAYGTNDEFFSRNSNNEYGSLYPKLQEWTWNNIKKSGATLLELEGATHTADYNSGSVSEYIVSEILLGKKHPKIYNEKDFLKLLELYKI